MGPGRSHGPGVDDELPKDVQPAARPEAKCTAEPCGYEPASLSLGGGPSISRVDALRVAPPTLRPRAFSRNATSPCVHA